MLPPPKADTAMPFSYTSDLKIRELSPSDRIFDVRCSAYESGCPSNVIGYATTTAGSGQFSLIVTRRSLVRGGFSRDIRAESARSAFGMRPKYLVTSSIACAVVEVADDRERRVGRDVVRVCGTRARLSTDAASRSFMLPMVVCLYGLTV